MPGEPLDVTANGYKHGATKKALGTPKARYKKMNTKYIYICQRKEVHYSTVKIFSFTSYPTAANCWALHLSMDMFLQVSPL